MSKLFEPFEIGALRLSNRIVIAPMCQYSASEGSAVDWHLIHLGHLALSGAGLLIVEATAVSPEGRITPADLGLYSDANEQALARVLGALREVSPIKLGMQLAHAGRKASSRAPWEGGKQIRLGEPGAWQAVAPSAVPHSPAEDAPLALDAAGLQRVRELHADPDRRVRANGVEHASERRFVRIAVQAEVRRRDSALGRDRRRLDDQEARARDRQMSEMDQVPVARRPFAGRVLAHRRDDDAVGEAKPADLERLEESAHRAIVDRSPRPGPQRGRCRRR